MDTAREIAEGKTVLGIELGSTRIKAVLIDSNYDCIASGGHDWENRFQNGLWTYSLDDVWKGIACSFRELAGNVQDRYNVSLSKVAGAGISAMMHGYMVFDKNSKQLVPFRTWRNTTTGKAAAELTAKFKFNIPLRWNIAHLYQAVLDEEPHVRDISFLTTLSGYVQWKLTGKKVLGPDEASGMFPVDSSKNDFNSEMLDKFDEITARCNFPWKIRGILPKVANAGEDSGRLSPEGALLLDPDGNLIPGIPFCPPEGDAGTGMIATNSVAERTGNVSAGTSIFAMVVLEKPLSKVYPEIDMVVTPAGKPVAMVHCNNCTTDIDAWINIFMELAGLTGSRINKTEMYSLLYSKALEGNEDSGNLLSYNYYGGEPLTGIDRGRPLFVRMPDSNFNIPNFMRTLLFSAMGTLKIGMDILAEKENVRLDSLLGHGGLFKTKGAGQRLMAGAFNTPVSVMESASEGGAWGIALLAAYMIWKEKGETLEEFLSDKVFAGRQGVRIDPDPKDTASFKKFMERYIPGLEIERSAGVNI